MAMTQEDFDFERDLTDAFAPVKMPLELQRRLAQVPQLYPQRRASWLGRLLPRPWLDGLMLISTWPAFGMTTGAAAACCSLVIGLSLGLGGALPQTQATRTTTVVASASTTSTSDNDAVSLLYAAADMPGELP
jgi:hypothetical protein